MILLFLAITVNITWLGYFIFKKNSEALPSFLVMNHLELLVADLRAGKAAEPYEEVEILQHRGP